MVLLWGLYEVIEEKPLQGKLEMEVLLSWILMDESHFIQYCVDVCKCRCGQESRGEGTVVRKDV